MREVGIVVDSSADIPADMVRAWGIGVAPVVLIADDQPTVMTPDIDRTHFINRMEKCKKFSTSGANPGDFYSAFEEMLGKAKSVVALALAKEISVTYNSAVTAAEMLDAGKVKVYDARSLYLGPAALTLGAARLAQAGATADQVCAYLEKVIPACQTLIISPNLAFIRGIGRVTENPDAPGKELKLAIVRCAEGKIMPVDAAADFDEAIKKVVAMAEQAAGRSTPLYGVVAHARQDEGAAKLQSALRERLQFRELARIDESPIGVVLGGIGSASFGFCAA